MGIENRPLAISIGEPAGIGPDLILRIFAQREELGIPAFQVFGAVDFLRVRAQRLGLSIKVKACAREQANAAFAEFLPVVDVADTIADTPGTLDKTNSPTVMRAIEMAVKSVLNGAHRGLVTSPIHKGVLIEAGFTFPGHTEFLAHLCAKDGATPDILMMLAADDLRAVPFTIHIPFRDVPAQISSDAIGKSLRLLHAELQNKFGIGAPKIAVCGLNPHAGEDGHMGDEEIEIIGPALDALRKEGINVHGPLPADSAFAQGVRDEFDAILTMYHDQALAPMKAVAFDRAVNVTLGLPIVRTSPDHGTALSLAGTGKGDISSFVEAMRLADRMSA